MLNSCGVGVNGLPVKPPQVVFGRMIEGEKKPCFFLKTSDIYNIKELCLRLFKTFLPAASIGRYLSFASCARF